MLKGKQLTNIRASGTDEAVALSPPIQLTLEKAIAYIADDELVEVIQEFSPDIVAVEDLFFATNAKATLKLGQTRGVALLAGANENKPIAEYSPLEVKQSVVGYGRADKAQVRDMVTRLLNLKEKPEPFDASDALAVAICHIHTATSNARIQNAGQY